MPLRFAEPAAEAYRFPLTIRHLLDAALVSAGTNRIVYRDRHSFTYSELQDRIGRLASALAALGATPGMTVAVMDWDSHRYLEAYFAVPMMGAVLQTVNVRLPPPQILHTLLHAEAEILLVHRDFFALVDALLPALPRVRAVVAILDDAEGPLPVFAVGEYEALTAAASPTFPFEDFDEDALATIFYTSGTTGDPKGVCFTHRQLVLHSIAGNAPFGVTRGGLGFGVEDVYMPLTPMFHVHAWGMPYIATMLGVTQVYPGRYEPDLICRLRTAHNVTYSHCVPTIAQMVFAAADATGADLSGWKMTIGGSAMSRALCAEGERRGMILIAGYGMSETCPLIAITRPYPDEARAEDHLSAMTATGVPVPLTSVRIVDEAMRPLPHDGVARGELVLRAPWLTPCYVGDEAASARLWEGGWLHTQDIATIDERGYIRICDRLKDVIKTGGEWIDSIQLEQLVGTAAGVAEAAVVAVPDPRWGERPLAVVVAAPGAAITLDALNAPIERAIAAGAITRYARLDRFVTVPELPRTSVGKIDKKAMRAAFAEMPVPATGDAPLSAAPRV